MSELAHPVYCIKCKKQIQADAQFCPYCGSGQKPPHSPEPPHASPTSPGPNTGPNVSQNVHVQVNNSAAGWIAATILAVFGTPIGCIVIPCLLLGAFCLLSIFGTVAMAGMMLFPTLLGLIVAFVIVRSNRSDADRTKGAIVALAAGFVFNVAWWYLLQGRGFFVTEEMSGSPRKKVVFVRMQSWELFPRLRNYSERIFGTTYSRGGRGDLYDPRLEGCPCQVLSRDHLHGRALLDLEQVPPGAPLVRVSPEDVGL